MENNEQVLKQEEEIQQPSVKLIKGQRGNYGWEIKSYNKDISKATEEVVKEDKKLQELFKNV